MATISTRTLAKSVMKKLIQICTSIILALLFVANSNAQQPALDLQAFNKQAFEQVKQKYHGNKWLVLLWSVDCPPCMKELALVQKLQQQKQDLAVVIINVDTGEESASQRREIIRHFDLTNQLHLYFREGLEDHSRFLIDPQWFGELPRSYFIDEAGKFHGKSGLVAKELLQKWLLGDKA